MTIQFLIDKIKDYATYYENMSAKSDTITGKTYLLAKANALREIEIMYLKSKSDEVSKELEELRQQLDQQNIVIKSQTK